MSEIKLEKFPNVTVSKVVLPNDSRVFYNKIHIEGDRIGLLFDGQHGPLRSLLESISDNTLITIHSRSEMLTTWGDAEFQMAKEAEIKNVTECRVYVEGGVTSIVLEGFVPDRGRNTPSRITIKNIDDITFFQEQERRCGILVTEVAIVIDEETRRVDSWLQTFYPLRQFQHLFSLPLFRALTEERPAVYRRRFDDLFQKNVSINYVEAMAAAHSHSLKPVNEFRFNLQYLKENECIEGLRWDTITSLSELPLIFAKDQYDLIRREGSISLIPSRLSSATE